MKLKVNFFIAFGLVEACERFGKRAGHWFREYYWLEQKGSQNFSDVVFLKHHKQILILCLLQAKDGQTEYSGLMNYPCLPWWELHTLLMFFKACGDGTYNKNNDLSPQEEPWSGIITPSAWTRSTSPVHTYHWEEFVLLLNVTLSHHVWECTLLQWPNVCLQNVECVYTMLICVTFFICLCILCAFCVVFVTYKEAINRLLKKVTTCVNL